MATSRPRPASRVARANRGAAAFAGAAALVVFVALLPWFPAAPRLEEGSTASRTFVAPRAVSFESAVITEERRSAAAAAVPEILVQEPAVATRQVADLERRLDRINVARRDPTLSPAAREIAVRAAADGGLTERAAVAWATAPDDQFARMAEQARSVLGRLLAGTLPQSEVDAARLRVPGLLSPDLSAEQALAVSELIVPLVVPTLVVDQERTAAQRAAARAAQPTVLVELARGQVVVAEGESLTLAHLEALDRLGLRRSGLPWEQGAAAVAISILVGAVAGGYLAVAKPVAIGGLRRQALFLLLLALPVLAAKFALPRLLPDEERLFLAFILPLAAAPLAAAVLLDLATALLLATVLAFIVGFIATYLPVDGGALTSVDTMRLVLTAGVGSMAGALVAERAERMQRFLGAGAAIAASSALALLAMWFIDTEREARDLLWMAGAAATSGFLAAVIAVGMFVVLSRPFGIVTRIELMELAQLSHPLLRRLQDEAPGTFQHSVLVGNLAERAADRIGADPLLTRVGAYYHDIGKLTAPGFFVENAPGQNPHEGLDPLQSTRVIHQHVTAGVELARRERLPAAVTRFIPEHHGTRLMTFFYRRAAEADPHIDVELFRYPGPKPQSRESALVMLADASEATVRASNDRSPERVSDIVEGIIRERIEEGQLSECPISMRDLAVVRQSFSTALAAIYHPRVEYPEPTARELAERRVEYSPERPGPSLALERPQLAPPPAAPDPAPPKSALPPSSSAPAPAAESPNGGSSTPSSPPPDPVPVAPEARESEPALTEDDT